MAWGKITEPVPSLTEGDTPRNLGGELGKHVRLNGLPVPMVVAIALVANTLPNTPDIKEPSESSLTQSIKRSPLESMHDFERASWDKQSSQ